MMRYCDAESLREALTARVAIGPTARTSWWEPGDSTRYRVTYVESYHTVSARSADEFLVMSVGNDTIVIEKLGGKALWDARSFLAKFGDERAGWWAGIRPVLAALGWTSTRPDDFTYSVRDAVEIGELLREM